MCIACPARVLSKSESKADVLDALGRQRTVTCPIDVEKGDYVLISMGFAIEKITNEQYNEFSEQAKCLMH